MIRAWTPELRVETRAGRCRMTLVGVTYGNGATLQEASRDLVCRVLDLALALRAGFRASTEARPDPQVVEYLWEIGEMATRGGDIRARVLGFADDLPAR